MDGASTLVVAGAVVVVSAIVAAAFKFGWIDRFKFERGETNVEASKAPKSDASPETQVTNSEVIDTDVKNRSGKTTIEGSSIEGSNLENG